MQSARTILVILFLVGISSLICADIRGGFFGAYEGMTPLPKARHEPSGSVERRVPDLVVHEKPEPKSIRSLADTPEYGYKVTAINKFDHGYIINAAYTGRHEYYSKKTSPIVKNLRVTIYYINADECRVKIQDNDNAQPEVPDYFPFPYDRNFTDVTDVSYTIDVVKEPFYFRVTRKATGEVLFTTENNNLILSKYYLEIKTTVPTDDLFGLGERAFQFKLRQGTFSIFAADSPFCMEDGTAGHNLYSTHPVYLVREKSNNFHMVFMRTPSAMDIVIDQGSAYAAPTTIQYKMVSFPSPPRQAHPP